MADGSDGFMGRCEIVEPRRRGNRRWPAEVLQHLETQLAAFITARETLVDQAHADRLVARLRGLADRGGSRQTREQRALRGSDRSPLRDRLTFGGARASAGATAEISG